MGQKQLATESMQLMWLFVISTATLGAALWLAVTRRRRLPLPPGPPKLPLIGNMLIMDQMSHRGLAQLAQRYGGLLHLRLGFSDTMVVSSPEMAREVLQVKDSICANRPATASIRYLTYDRSDMAFAHYGPFWRQMRKICVMKLFSRKRAESWASVRDEVDNVVRIIAQTPPGTPVNVGELVFALTMNITYRAAFGASAGEGQAEFISILQEFSKLFGIFNIADFLPLVEPLDLQGINRRLKAARGSLDRFIDTIIQDHIANPKAADDPNNDMVDEMLAYLDDGTGAATGQDPDTQTPFRITTAHIKAIIMDVMFGGTETVASAIEWAMAELMKSPEDMKRVQEELAVAAGGLDRKIDEADLEKVPYLKCCLKETLRLHPPIPILLHETAEECEIGGYRVPARARMMINAWAICRHPSAWEDPDTFKPSRFADFKDAPDFRGNCYEFIPFGSGRRSCPGMQLGLYSLDLAVAQLLHCFTWELPDGMKPSDLDMSDVFGLTAPKAVRLVAVPTPRVSCPLA